MLFFTATVHYTLTGAGKHLSCKESSKNIFANSIIRFNAPINYCFCCLCCLIWLTFNSYSIIISLPPRIAFSSALSWQSRQKMITPWYKFWFKYLFYLQHWVHILLPKFTVTLQFPAVKTSVVFSISDHSWRRLGFHTMTARFLDILAYGPKDNGWRLKPFIMYQWLLIQCASDSLDMAIHVTQ